MTTILLAVALILALAAIGFLWREIYKLRRKNERYVRDLQKRSNVYKELREAEDHKCRLVMENLALRAQVVSPQVKDSPRSSFGQSTIVASGRGGRQ